MRRKTLRCLLTLVAVTLMLLLTATATLAQEGNGEVPADGDVVFQDGFEDWMDANQRVESDWQTWSRNDCNLDWDGDISEVCASPEYKQANPAGAYPYRTHAGENAQQYHTTHQGHHAGVWRRFAVEPGTIIEVHAWGTAWATESNDPHAYDPGQNVRMRIGVDPNGGSNPSGSAVVWGDPANPPNEWQEVPPVTVTAGESGQVSVFLSSNPKYPTPHNDIYWDDVYALKVGTAPNLPDGNADAGEGGSEGGAGGPDGSGVQAAAAQVVPPPDPILEGMVGSETVPDHPARTGDARWLWAPMLGLTLAGYLALTRKEII